MDTHITELVHILFFVLSVQNAVLLAAHSTCWFGLAPFRCPKPVQLTASPLNRTPSQTALRRKWWQLSPGLAPTQAMSDEGLGLTSTLEELGLMVMLGAVRRKNCAPSL